jgi:glycosyltransferase involved in cell wall biosynthesis
VSSAQIPAVLADYDALLIPSMWFENGPTIALESMAVGTPIIASRVGNLAEIIDDGVCGRLVEAGDEHAIAQVLRDAATNPAATIDVWRRGLRSPRTMDEVTADYLSLYAA